MSFALLDVVVLRSDVTEHGLRAGDLGTIVEVYTPREFEVEFVRPNGMTKAVVMLRIDQVRAIEPTDMVSVRTAETDSDPG